jgi:hypothetical protein
MRAMWTNGFLEYIRHARLIYYTFIPWHGNTSLLSFHNILNGVMLYESFFFFDGVKELFGSGSAF